MHVDDRILASSRLRNRVVELGTQRGWWQTGGDTDYRIAARVLPRTGRLSVIVTRWKVAAAVLDAQGTGVPYHLFRLPPHLERELLKKGGETTAQEVPVTGLSQPSTLAPHRVGSVLQFLEGTTFLHVAAAYERWNEGDPIPLPYFSDDD